MADISAVKEITDKLESGVKELFESDKYAEYLRVMSKFHRYSLRNQQLIYMQKPDATYCNGYNRWKNEFNRQVKKGEHGIKIFAPIVRRDKDIEAEKLDPVTKQPILDENGQPVMERLSPVSNLQVRFKVVTVFDISSTEGDPLPMLAETLTGGVERYELFMDTLRAVSPLPIVFEDLPESTDGVCRFGEKITIRNGMSEAQTVSAVIHEITHAKLHDRELLAESGGEGKDRRLQEQEAESVSYIVNYRFGVDTGANSFGYICEYAKDKELKALNASLDLIRKTAAELIDAIDDKYRELAKERGIDLTIPREKTEPAPEFPETPNVSETARKDETQTVKYTDFQIKGFDIAKSLAHLPLQDRLDIIAETFGRKTARVQTSLCTGKWRGTSDISIILDNGASLFVGNYRTPNAKKAATINECVDKALAMYNPQTVADAKRKAALTLLEREIKDNEAAAEHGLKPYKFLTVELNDGSNANSGGYLGWYYVTLAVDGKIFGFVETGLNYDIAAGKLDHLWKRENYFVAGGVKDGEVDFVFNNVGHSSFNGSHQIAIGADIIKRAREALERRERFQNALEGLKKVEQTERKTLENRLYDKLDGDPVPSYRRAESKREPEPEPPKTIDLSLPDPTITTEERDKYGYTYAEMLPIRPERALELFDTGHPVYQLYPDNTEAMVLERDEIIFNAQMCGIEKADWEISPVRRAQMAVAESTTKSSPNREGVLEAALLYGTGNRFGIYQIKGDIDEARNFRFAAMSELAAHGIAPNRSNYELVYTAPFEDKIEFLTDRYPVLNKIYERFNFNPPSDFTGHSLSVSDVVALQWDGQISSHYVDRVGFHELDSFIGDETRFETAKIAGELAIAEALSQTSAPMSKPIGDPGDTKSEKQTEAPRRTASKAQTTLMGELAEAKQLAARGSQPTAKPNEREVL